MTYQYPPVPPPPHFSLYIQNNTELQPWSERKSEGFLTFTKLKTKQGFCSSITLYISNPKSSSHKLVGIWVNWTPICTVALWQQIGYFTTFDIGHQLRMLEVIEKSLPNTSFGLYASHILSRSSDSTKGATLIGNKMTFMLLFERRFCTYMHPIQSGILN